MHSMAYGRSGDHRPSRGSRNAAATETLGRSAAPDSNKNARDFAVPDEFEPSKPSNRSSPKDKHPSQRNYYGEGRGGGGGNCNENDDHESVGSSPTPPPEPERPDVANVHSQAQRSNGHSAGSGGGGRNDGWEPPLHSLARKSARARCNDYIPAGDLLDIYASPTNGKGCRVAEGRDSRLSSPGAPNPGNKKKATLSTASDHESNPTADFNAYSSSSSGSSKPQRAEVDDDEGDGGGCGSYRRDLPLSVDVPYPAKWRCFGRRPPAILEYRPMGEPRTHNVRPAGKQSYLMRRADEKRGCDSRILEGDLWDDNYGLAKPVTEKWTDPLPYGETRVLRTGDTDPWFTPSRGDIIIINPAQNYYRAMKSGYVMSLRDGYTFGIGDLVLRLGKFLASGQYVPYGNLELYMHTPSREWRFLGRQPYLLVDFNYHNLDYESPGKYLAIGTFLTESFVPRRGDVIIRGGAWAENYPNTHRRHHTSVRYWRPNTEFMPNDMLLRPYVDVGRCERTREFYWGAAELYSFSGKGLAWAYWGRDHHICDTPFPGGDNEPIKTGHHKDETGYYGSNNFEQRGA